MEYHEQNNYPKAFAATGVTLVALAALCYFIVFTTPPKPVEGTGGILVNYGTSDQGMGTDYTSMEQPSVAPKANHTLPNKITPAPPTEQKTQVDNSDKKVLTQNNEDAPTVAANSKKTSPTVATHAAKAVPKPVVNQNALYKGKASSGTGAGDGTTNTPGNQGKPNGSTLTNNYNGTGSGNGGIGLGNRTWLSSPAKPSVHNISGKVVIDWVVDKNGNIVQVSIGRGTTVADDALIEKCLNAVRNAKVSADENAPENQQQHTTFIFKLD
jgi:outer membrane biosynthesis protein TonB